MAITTGRPGAFVTESLIPLTTTPPTPGQALAAFVGTHNAGPIGPTLVSSWAQWKTLFGGFGNGTDLLPFSVYEYFANGGSSAYIVRAVPSDATQATITLNDIETTPQPLLKLTAIAPGVAGNTLFIDIVAGATNSGRFNLIVHNGTAAATPVEQYLDVSLNPTDPRNLVAMISSSTQGSRFLTAQYLPTAAYTTNFTPAAQTGTPLTAGVAGSAAIDLVGATELLSNVVGILNINLPGVSDPTVINPLIAWASAAGDRFLVVDAPAQSGTYANTVTAYTNLSPLGSSGGTPFTSSSYLSVYGPWLAFADPSSSVVGATRALPPGGAMLGLYSVADQSAGTQQSAAGVRFPIAGAVSPQVVFAASDLDNFNQLGINIIRTVPGTSGLVPMGARTLSSGMPDRYTAIRRTLMYIRTLVIQATQFAIFRPNNSDLWDQISSLLTDQLSTLQQAGVLKGATANEAFYVICDQTNNSSNSIANGIVNIEVGVALNTPAEFIVIQIGQIASGATVTDNLSS